MNPGQTTKQHRTYDAVGIYEVPREWDSSTSRAGFSLMELLIVMIVIAVMTGIASGQYTSYREDRTGQERARRGQLRVAHQVVCHPAAEPRDPGRG
jgi:prepilin-type N-terminal cleavage/methylation domain-containing protein